MSKTLSDLPTDLHRLILSHDEEKIELKKQNEKLKTRVEILLRRHTIAYTLNDYKYERQCKVKAEATVCKGFNKKGKPCQNKVKCGEFCHLHKA